MSDLDKKLEAIIASGQPIARAHEDLVGEIKQALIDDGWQRSYAPQYREVNIACDSNGEPYPAMRRDPTPEQEDKWNESDMLLRWPPEFLKIAGTHSTIWKYSKPETLSKIEEWLDENYTTGQEWYEKFVSELEDNTVRNSHGCFLREGEQFSGTFFELKGVKQAAKKAAGIE